MFNLFQTKEFQNPVYEGLARSRGFTRNRTSNRYRSMALKGYKQNGIVFACLEKIIRASGALPFCVGTLDADGKEVTVKNHPMNQVLDQTNEMYGMKEFKLRAILFYFLAGHAPIHMMDTILGSLYTYRPDEVQFETRGTDLIPYSNVYYQAGFRTNIPPEEFTLWKRFDPLDFLDGLGNGMAMIEPILKEIDQRNSSKEWNISLLEEGARFSGILSTEQQLPDDVYNRTDRKLKEKHRGRNNVGGVLFVDGGLKFQETSITPKDMDFIEGEKNVTQQICSGMNVDPILVGYNEYSSYNNKQEAKKALYTENVIPLMEDLADVLTQIFRRLNKIKPTEKVLVITTDVPVLQKDMKETAERLEKSPFTENEKRIELGKEEIQGLDIISDNKYLYDVKNKQMYIPMNMVKVGEEDKPIPQDTRKPNTKDFRY